MGDSAQIPPARMYLFEICFEFINHGIKCISAPGYEENATLFWAMKDSLKGKTRQEQRGLKAEDELPKVRACTWEALDRTLVSHIFLSY